MQNDIGAAPAGHNEVAEANITRGDYGSELRAA